MDTQVDTNRWPWITIGGVLLCIVLFLGLVGLLFWFTELNKPAVASTEKTAEQKLHELRADDQSKLTQAGWNADKKTAHMPIEWGMKKVIEERGKAKP